MTAPQRFCKPPGMWAAPGEGTMTPQPVSMPHSASYLPIPTSLGQKRPESGWEMAWPGMQTVSLCLEATGGATEPGFPGTVSPPVRGTAWRECFVGCRESELLASCGSPSREHGFLSRGPRTLAHTPPTRLQSCAMEGAGACDGQGAGLPAGFVRFLWALLPIGAWRPVGVV